MIPRYPSAKASSETGYLPAEASPEAFERAGSERGHAPELAQPAANPPTLAFLASPIEPVVPATQQNQDRQSALDALERDLVEAELLPRTNIEKAYERAVLAEEQAKALGDPVLRMRAQLLQTHILCRRGLNHRSVTILRRVNNWATVNDHLYLRARSHRLLSMLFRTLGDYPQMLEHASHAAGLLDQEALTNAKPDLKRLIVESNLSLADALALTGYTDRALAQYRQAAHDANSIGDRSLQVSALNNLAYFAWDNGDLDRAYETAMECQELSERHQLPMDVQFIDTLARIQLSLGHDRQALATLQPVIDEVPEVVRIKEAFALGLMTLSTLYRKIGMPDKAETALLRCAEVVEGTGMNRVIVQTLVLRAELRAEAGDHRTAYELQRDAYERDRAMHSVERDSRARTVNALYEVTETRKNADKFRMLSLIDPLTGLYNRRFVESALPELLEREAQIASPVTVALLDLDFFKRVNDECSHETGDTVLKQVANILRQHISSGGAPGTNEANSGKAETPLVLQKPSAGAAGPLVSALRSSDFTVAQAPSLPPLVSKAAEDPSTESFVSRLGGEEFLVVVPGCDDIEANRLLQTVLEKIREWDWVPITGKVPVTVSIGMVVTVGETDHAEVLRQADRHLYEAKQGGRDRLISSKIVSLNGNSQNQEVSKSVDSKDGDRRHGSRRLDPQESSVTPLPSVACFSGGVDDYDEREGALVNPSVTEVVLDPPTRSSHGGRW